MFSIFSPWQYLPPDCRSALKNYTYVGKDHSYYYRYFLRPIVLRVAEYVPRNVAPNVITLFGLFLVILSHVVTWWYMPSLREQHNAVDGGETPERTPSWVFVINGLSFFSYQVLDNLDGLQARRTGTSSPLGLLFDHGCDAINAIVMTLTIAATMQSGASWKTWVALLCSLSGFFLNTWEELFRGELILPVINAPNEGIFTGILLQFITAWYGTGMWYSTTSIPTPKWVAVVLDASSSWMPHWELLVPEVERTGYIAVQWNTLFVLSLMCCTLATLAGNVYNVYVAVQAGVHHGINAESQSFLLRRSPFLYAMTRLLPLLLLVGMANVWLCFSPQRIFQRHPRICCWTIGLIFSKSVMHVMLAHITASEYHPLRKTLLPILFLGVHIGAHVLFTRTVPQLHESVVLLEMFALLLASYVHMVISVVVRLSRLLEIPIFTVPSKEKGKVN